MSRLFLGSDPRGATLHKMRWFFTLFFLFSGVVTVIESDNWSGLIFAWVVALLIAPKDQLSEPSGTGQPEDMVANEEDWVLLVIYLGGFAGHRPKGGRVRQSLSEAWELRIGSGGISVVKILNQLAQPRFVVREEPWEQIEFVSIEDAGTRPDLAALALFGVLGLSSRKPATLITVGYEDGEVQFLALSPQYEFRRLVSDVVLMAPEAGQRLRLGSPPGMASNPESSVVVLSTVEQLLIAKDLLDQKVLTEAEFTRLKAELIGTAPPELEARAGHVQGSGQEMDALRGEVALKLRALLNSRTHKPVGRDELDHRTRIAYIDSRRDTTSDLCPRGHLVQDGDRYCGSCGEALFAVDSLPPG